MRRSELEFMQYGCLLPVDAGEIRILLLSDIQIIDSAQQRFSGRLSEAETEAWRPERVRDNAYKYVEEAVRRTSPHLIITAGDNIYGEFDDSGAQFLAFTEFMDSFRVPWAPVFGNHDNESKKGVLWQSETLENSAYCLFMRGCGPAEGNGNYIVTLVRGGVPVRSLLMCDTHGCLTAPGIFPGQTELFRRGLSEIAARFGSVPPLFACFHIGGEEFARAYVNAGLLKEYDPGVFFDIDAQPGMPEGDSGRKHETLPPAGANSGFMEFFRENGGDGVFSGHYHRINTSVYDPSDGIRYTFGLKTGTYDYHDSDRLGGTLITVFGDGRGEFRVEHKVSGFARGTEERS